MVTTVRISPQRIETIVESEFAPGALSGRLEDPNATVLVAEHAAGDTSFVDTVKDGLVVLFAFGVAVVATVGTTVVFAVFPDVIPLGGYVMPLVLLVGLVVAFFPMYYVFPDHDLDLRDVLPGALFAAVGWAASQGLFQVYLAFSDPGAGGFASGILVVITYLYFSALVLLLGAVINAVMGGYSSGRTGGVGAGAGPRETRREASLDRAEVDVYLRVLNERLTTTCDVAGSDDDGLLPRPDGDVHLVEYRTDGETGSQWTVELRWTPATGSTPGRSGESVAHRAED
jgi:membrane protein